MDIKMSFPGGLKVDACFGPFHVHTDQSKEEGGEGSAPEPFDLFLASLAACAGFYVMRFCQSRDIPTDGIEVTQTNDWNSDTRRMEHLTIEIKLPASFPAKYEKALVRVVDQCSVKRAILSPPEFEIRTTIAK